MSRWPYNTQRWQRLRRLKLRLNPLCESCLQVGRIEPAAAVDHRTPISERGRKERLITEAFPPLDQLASLCARCHNSKSNAEQRGEDYLTKGCDVFGYPLDARHPWYKNGATKTKGSSR
jgi:5-methylcytosine-specific restriction endonuclease McrA